MKRNITVAVIVVFIIGAVWILIAQKGAVDPVTTRGPAGQQMSTTTTPTSAGQKTYTRADIEKHASQSSCWTSVNGKVYDVTLWISRHPGGAQAILSLCGKDGSSAFNEQHGGQTRPATELASFTIGDLAQ